MATLELPIQQRYDTAANWTSSNPVLRQAEMGVETDTNKFKFGNGTDAWADLEYVGGTGFDIIDVLDGDASSLEVNDWTGAAGKTVVGITNSVDAVTLKGISATSVVDGQELTLIIFRDQGLSVSFEDVGSAAANRLHGPSLTVAGQAGSITFYGSITVLRFVYGPTQADGSNKRWILSAGQGSETTNGSPSTSLTNVTGGAANTTYTSDPIYVNGGPSGGGAVACVIKFTTIGAAWNTLQYSTNGGATWTNLTSGEARFIASSTDAIKVRGTSNAGGFSAGLFAIDLGNARHNWQINP